MQPQRASCCGRQFWPTALGVLCAAQLATHPAAGAQLKFLDKADLSGVGLRLRIMSNAREIPLPAPLAHTYMLTSGTQRKRVEMYRPYDLWISDQHAARWQDRYGNILTIALVRRPLPVGFPREHVTPEDYKTRADQTKIPANWSPRDLADWLAGMSEVAGITAETVAKPPTRFSSLVRFSFPAHERRIAYAFQMNPKGVCT